MENILEMLKGKWEEARVPLEEELSSIQKDEAKLKMELESQIRQRNAQIKLCENEALGLEARAEFMQCDTMRLEKKKLEASIEIIKQEVIVSFKPLEERAAFLEEELKKLPGKIMDKVFPEMQKKAFEAVESGILSLENTLLAIQDFQRLSQAEFGDTFLNRLRFYDHTIFNTSKEIWKRLKKWVGTPIA